MTISSDLRLCSRFVARIVVGAALRARQLVADRHLAVLGVVRCGLLLAGLARAHHAALGIELLRGLGDAVEVEIGGELHARASRPDDRGHDRPRPDRAAGARRPICRSSAVVAEGGVRAGAVGEEAAGFVHDRHPLGLEAVDRGGDEVANRPHLLRLELAAHLEHDRGGGFRLVAREQRPLGQHQVHARRLDAVERPDGARQLSFERPQVVDVLDEARGAERIGLVEDLVAHAAALGQAALGELHAQPGDPVLGYQHDGAVVLEFVGDGLAVEVLDDRGRILERQIGEQRRHLRRRDAHHQDREEADQRHRHRRHGGDSRRTQRFDELDDALHVFRARDDQPGKNCLVYGYCPVKIVNERGPSAGLGGNMPKKVLPTAAASALILAVAGVKCCPCRRSRLGGGQSVPPL